MTSTKKTQQKNTMQKIGEGLKDTFVEMSASLAGWIDDTGAQFSGETKTTKKRTNRKTSNAKIAKPQPEV